MSAVGVWLVSIGLADLVAGLSGEPRPGLRTIWGIATGVASPLALSILCGAVAGTVALLTSITGAGWLLLRRDAPRMSAIRALVALGPGARFVPARVGAGDGAGHDLLRRSPRRRRR